MFSRFNSQKFKSFIPYFLFAVAVIVAYRTITELRFFADSIGQIWRIVTPFFYGFLLAYILNIPRSGIEKLLSKTKLRLIVNRKKGISVLLTFLLFLLIVAFVLSWLIPTIVDSVSHFIASFPTHYENALRLIQNVNELDFLGFYINIDEISGLLQEFVQSIGFDGVNVLLTGTVVIFNSFFVAFLTLISSIYILVEKENFKAFLLRALRVFVPDRVYHGVVKYADKLNKNFKRYIYTQTIDGCILGTMATILLFLVGSPYALLLGIMLGIVNYIPYFGSIFGSLVAIVVVLFTQGLTIGLITAVTLLIIQQIDGNFIQPRLMGGSFSLSPLLVIISITFGGAFAGILGMIAAIPIVAVLKDILDSLISYFEWRKCEKPKEAKESGETKNE